MPLVGIGGDAQFSPDGSLVLYGSQQQPGTSPNIYPANADGSEARVLVGYPRCYGVCVLAMWFPDGTRIAYWEFHGAGDPPGGTAFVMDLATLYETEVAEGVQPVWLNDHTLLVEHDRCQGPTSDGCGG